MCKPPLARLIQNGFTDETKAGEARKTSFSRFLVHFNPSLQNGFTLQCLNLRKIDETEADISRVKEALNEVNTKQAGASRRADVHGNRVACRQSW